MDDQVDGNLENAPDGRLVVATSADVEVKAVQRISELIGQTLEEEIFILNSLDPSIVKRLPTLFSDSVVDSLTIILGASSGEALIRCIGEMRLQSPAEVYKSLDAALRGGAEILKSAIREDFRVRIHRLCKTTMNSVKITMDMASWLGSRPDTTST